MPIQLALDGTLLILGLVGEHNPLRIVEPSTSALQHLTFVYTVYIGHGLLAVIKRWLLIEMQIHGIMPLRS